MPPTPDFFDGAPVEPPNSDAIKTHCVYSCDQGDAYTGPFGIPLDKDPNCKWYCFGNDLNPAKLLQDAMSSVDAMKNQILGFIMDKNMFDNDFIVSQIIPAVMGGNTADGIKDDILAAVEGMKGAEMTWVMDTLLPAIEDSGHAIKENVFELIDIRDDAWKDWITDGVGSIVDQTRNIGEELGRGLKMGEALGKHDIAMMIKDQIQLGMADLQQWIEDNLPIPPTP